MMSLDYAGEVSVYRDGNGNLYALDEPSLPSTNNGGGSVYGLVLLSLVITKRLFDRSSYGRRLREKRELNEQLEREAQLEESLAQARQLDQLYRDGKIRLGRTRKEVRT